MNMLSVRSVFQAVPVPNTLILRISGGLHFANISNVQYKIEKLLKKELQDETKPMVSLCFEPHK